MGVVMFIDRLLIALSLLLLAVPLGHAQNSAAGGLANPASGDLAPVFRTSDDGIAYVSQQSDTVFWFAEHPGRGYSHVFRGTRSGADISGRFVSVPKYASTSTGRARFHVDPGGILRLVGPPSAIPFNRMEPVAMADVRDQLPMQAWPAFHAQSAADHDGGFEDGRRRRYYVRTVGDNVVFFVESRFARGERPTAAFVFWGQWTGNGRVFATGPLIAVPKGQRKLSGTFSLGFLDDGRMSGKSDFRFLRSVLAHPMRRKQRLSLMGDRTPQDYETVIENGYATVEGDILVGEIPDAPEGTQMALAVTDKGKFWPDCVVPFNINRPSLVALPGEANPTRANANRAAVVANINAAVTAFNAAGPITWRQRTPADRDWVDFVAVPGLCADENGNEIRCGRSALGRSGGRQQIVYTLPTGSLAALETGVFIHEMGHAVGLSHEQSRADRDDFVRINRAAILPGREGNFAKRGGNSLEIGPYDYGSIMHYARTSFARAGMETVIPLDDSAAIGQRAGLSAGDLAALQHFCPAIIERPGVGRRGDGAGLALSDLDNDGRMDALLMAYDDAQGQNKFRVRQCAFSRDGTDLDCTGDFTVDGLGHRGEGAGIALGDLGQNRAVDDLILVAVDTDKTIKYRVCWDFALRGTGQCSDSRAATISTGRRADGLGVAVADIDGNPGDEVVIAVYDDADGQNAIKYIVGTSGDGLGTVRWDGPFREPGTGHRGDGLGVAVFRQGGSGRPEIMFSMLDDASGTDLFKSLTLIDVNTRGVSSGNSLIQRFHGHSNSSDGAGLGVADVDGDGSLDVVIMSYDDPGNDDARDNKFKLRLIRSGADF